ncbi:MAG: hypothetical protein WCX30_01690 [Candidatus Paceibacterota bacterium]|jgi:hypothetical protein|nr:hypothetical protein [bacterium]
MSNKIENQFLSLERSFQRLKDNYKKDPHIEDYVYSFFQDCFHFKNYVINSGLIDKNDVNDFIELNTDMKICRDICNGSKHCINNNPSIDRDIHKNINKRNYKIIKPITEEKHYCFIHGKNIPALDALELAENCCLLWKTFLIKNKLL